MISIYSSLILPGVMAAAATAVADQTYVSLRDASRTYVGGELLSKGGRGLVYAVEPDMAIKCDASKSLLSEAERMQLFPSTASILVDTAVPLTGKGREKVCIVMKRLGASLEATRDRDIPRVWSWATIASIGIILLDAAHEMHIRGFSDTDRHPGNYLLDPHDRSLLVPIDVGEAVPIDITTRQGKDTVLGELRQTIVSLRYLVDGDRRFFQEKKFSFKDVLLRRALLAGAPQAYIDIVEFLYSSDPSIAEVQYAWIRAKLVSIAGPSFTEGKVLWS